METNCSLTRWPLPLCLAVLLAVAVFALSAYRATTQSLTIDESTTFNLYVKDAPEALYALPSYRANHHVLHSALAWVAVSAFGFSEFSLRLPALLGGLLFLAGSLRLFRLAIGGGWYLPLACAAIWLNPIVLDHLAKARGYGLALAFSVLAMDGLLRWRETEEGSRSALARASLWMGLAVASNMVFAVWCGAFMLATFLFSMRGHWRPAHYAAATLPGLAVATLLVAIPLTKMQNLRYGALTWSDSLRSIVDSTLHHGSVPWSASILIAIGLSVLLLLYLAASLRWQDTTPTSWCGVQCVIAIGVSCLLYSVAQIFITDFRLPMHRTGLFLILGITVSMASFAAPRPGANRVERYLSHALSVALVLLVSSHLFELSASRFRTGSHDASARAVFHRLQELHESSGLNRPLSVGIYGWFYDSTLNAYREMYDADWMSPVIREKIPAITHDYLVVADESWHLARDYCILVERYPSAATRLVRWNR